MPTQPNVLFVFTDQQRHDWVGSDPDVPVHTPTLDALGERGVHFTNAVCPAPLCAPSRSCLASGLEYDRCGAWTNQDYPLDRPTLYERLREAGYETIGVGDIDLHMDSATWGIDGTYALDSMGFSDGIEIPGKRAMVGTYRSDLAETGHVDVDGDSDLPPDVDPGPDEPANAYMAFLRERGLLEDYVADMEDRLYADRPVSNFATIRPAPLPEDAYVDNWVGRHALSFLEDAPEDRPWHLAVNFVGPHEPMDVTEGMHGWYRDPDVEFPDPVGPRDHADSDDELDPETHGEIRRNYAAICENVDRWLGRFLDAIEERGERGETLVVFASDHGELLGDYGGWTKSSPRQASVGVPLVVAGPGVESRGRVDEPASVLDLHATFLEYAGLDPGDVDSRSLRPYLEGDTDGHREVVRSGLDPWRLAFDGRYKLIVGYDDDHDPLTGEFVGAFDPELEGGRVESRARIHETTDPILFDLRDDPEESTDVADEHPEVVERLRAHVGPGS